MFIGDRVVATDDGEEFEAGEEGVIVAPTEEDAHILLGNGEPGQVIGTFGAPGPHWLVLWDGREDPDQIPEAYLDVV